MVKVIGIDLGTSNSAASVMEGGSAVMIPSAEELHNMENLFQVLLHLVKGKD